MRRTPKPPCEPQPRLRLTDAILKTMISLRSAALLKSSSNSESDSRILRRTVVRSTFKSLRASMLKSRDASLRLKQSTRRSLKKLSCLKKQKSAKSRMKINVAPVPRHKRRRLKTLSKRRGKPRMTVDAPTTTPLARHARLKIVFAPKKTTVDARMSSMRKSSRARKKPSRRKSNVARRSKTRLTSSSTLKRA